MNTRKIALAVATGATLLAAAPAFADNRHDRGWRGQGYGHQRHHVHRHHHAHYYHRAPVYGYAPRAYHYAPPAPVYYAPPARYYGSPAPVVYGSVPIGDARVNFGVRF